jgi:hypothetical protein
MTAEQIEQAKTSGEVSKTKLREYDRWYERYPKAPGYRFTVSNSARMQRMVVPFSQKDDDEGAYSLHAHYEIGKWEIVGWTDNPPFLATGIEGPPIAFLFEHNQTGETVWGHFFTIEN